MEFEAVMLSVISNVRSHKSQINYLKTKSNKLGQLVSVEIHVSVKIDVVKGVKRDRQMLLFF